MEKNREAFAAGMGEKTQKMGDMTQV